MSKDPIKEKKKFKRPLLHKIVNVFIGIIGGILFLLIIFFGFSQTKTFRNILKNQITEYVSESLNGNLHIDKIDGSILSSIILHNTSLISEKDTLLKVDELVIKTSPIHLFLKRILIRDIIIKNAKLKLLEDKNGEWNISKLAKKNGDDTKVEESDTTSSSFPFSIQINNLNFQNLNFVNQTYDHVGSVQKYKYLTPDDLQLKNISLDAKLFANLSTSTVKFYLKNFSVNPNFQSFNLKKLSGEFELTKNYALVSNLNLISDSSNINISAKIDELNLLGNVKLKDFKEYPIQLKLEAFPIKFSDLSTFIGDIDFLNGLAYIDMQADGYFGDFDVKRLEMSFLNSNLSLKGKVQKLHTPENLFLDVRITDSKILESEAHFLIKGLDIPLYENLMVDNLNVKFKGEPTRFHAELSGDVNEGNLYLDTYLDLQNEQMDYNIEFNSNKLDLYPILGLNSSITSAGNIKGIGTDPNQMNAELNIRAFESVFDSIKIDSVFLTSSIQSKLLEIDLRSIINDASAFVKGELDLRNESEPIYNLFGKVQNFQLNKFTGDISDSSNLNLDFKADGRNLKLDNMVGNYEITLEPSYLKDLSLDETSIKLSLLKNEFERKINLQSEFADFNIEGQFSLEKAIDILAYEGSTIAEIIANKIDELNPIYDVDSLISLRVTDEIPLIVNEDLEFSYNFLFKDFELIAQFLGNDELDIIGSGEGTIINDSLHFEISTDVIIENLLNKKKNELFYLSNVEANINFSRDNREVSFNKMFGTISVEGEKIYTGIELNEVETDLIFNQSKLFFNTSVNVEDKFLTELEGTVSTESLLERIDLSNISVKYKNLPWTNYDTCVVIFSQDGVQLSNLVLDNGSTVINLDGQINNDESHNFFLNIENMPGEVLSTYLLEDEAKPFGGDINLDLVSSGFLENPKINLDVDIHNISYNDVNFGSLTCVTSHLNSSTLFDVDFTNTELGVTSPLLTLDATAPLKINYLNINEILDDDSEILISLRSNNFDIGSFGNILPYVKDQSGKIMSKVDIRGPLNNLMTNGYFVLNNGFFTSRQNNLDYNLGLKTVFDKQIASIDSMSLSNRGGSKYSGEIKGIGTLGLRQFPFSNFDFTLNGNLALLGKKSQTRNSNIYGDLYIKTDNDWKFTFEDDAYTFDGNIIVDRANLVYVTEKNTVGRQNERIIYKILEDTSKFNISNQKFIKILNETKLNSFEITNNQPSRFDINTNILIENIATFNFIISPELNQKLSVETTGQLVFETIENEMKAQGSLSLLSGSRLEFFKTFDAVGKIRFENDLTDPHFDIVATYIGEIEKFENLPESVEVAVKLKLFSAFSKLQENLSGNKENLSVYIGRSEIENDIPSTKYDQSNALTFVIFDQLSLDLNDEQKSTLGAMTENAAFSLLGSQLTNYLSSYWGGLISNIRLNKYSGRDSYKLLFSGKYNNIRYSFGGSFGSQTDYLQLSRADIKFEYLFNPNFLIRVEQKNPIIETTTDEKIREVGLKYKFEF
jgi:hypothetical protein